jgi:hypothetical protein
MENFIHTERCLGYDVKLHSLLQARIQEFMVGDDMGEEKIGGGLGAAVGPQRGPGTEPLVGVKGAKPPTKVTLFSRIIQ